MIMNCGSNPSKLWKVVNRFKFNFIHNDNTSRFSAIINMVDDLEQLNKHFANISACEKEQRTSPSYHSCGKKSKDTAQFTKNEVAAILSEVKKTSCCDNISWRFIKYLFSFIANVVTFLFNEISRSGKSPSWWKMSVITPIP